MRKQECIKVDSTTLKKIYYDFADKIKVTTLETSFPQFTITEDDGTISKDDEGNDMDYMINQNSPMVILSNVVSDNIPGAKEMEFDKFFTITYSYQHRFTSLIRILKDNREQLIKLGLIIKKPDYDMMANVLFDSAAVIPISRRGFKFRDLIQKAKVLIETA